VVSSADPHAAAAAGRALAALGLKVVAPRSPLRAGSLVVDTARHDVTCGGQLVTLSPTEFRLLVTLTERAGSVVPPAILLSEVWGPEYIDSIDSLKPVVSRLRRKLAACAGGRPLIETVRGFGYRLRAEIR